MMNEERVKFTFVVSRCKDKFVVRLETMLGIKEWGDKGIGELFHGSYSLDDPMSFVGVANDQFSKMKETMVTFLNRVVSEELNKTNEVNNG